MRFRLLPEALNDLDAIDDWITANFGHTSAEKARRDIVHTIQLLTRHQEMGVLKPEVTNEPVRFFRSGPNWVIYRVGDPLLVFRIFPAAKDVRAVRL